MNGLRMDERSAEVEVLEPKLSETADLSTEIALSFKELSASAQHVERAVKPIYNKTQSLTVPSGHIDELISAIDRVRQPTDPISKGERTIRQELALTTPLHGPSKTGLTEYFASLRRINEALSCLKKSNLRRSHKTVTQMTSRSEAGSLQLEDLFRQAFAVGSKSVEPLHFITKGVSKKPRADLGVFVKQNMAWDCFLAFDVIGNVQPASVRLKTKTCKQGGFAEALKPLRATAQSSFSYFLEDVKKTGQGLIALHLDNTVAEMTEPDGNWNRPYTAPVLMPPSFDLGADGTLLLSNLCSNAIDQLIHELEQKARVMIKKNSTVAVFMANNVHFIESNIRTRDFRKIMSNQARAKVNKWRKDAVKMYMEKWKERAAFLIDVTYTKHQGGGRLNLNSKKKEGVKEKFKNFNIVFEDLIQKQKSYTFRDKEVRAMLSKEFEFIGQLYGRLYD
ncbi:Cullin repeat-like-containing domain protein, partial [Tuber brumale]